MSLGTTIGPFELLATLGRGMRATVYRARHSTLGRVVAIKHCVESVAPDSDEYERLCAEVDRLKTVPARHVAAVMSVDLIDGRPLIEMESLGEGLDRAMHQRPLDFREALRVVMDILSGLRDMHAAGVVHANLKPSNVLQDTTNRSWKISDGGITGIETQTSPTLDVTSVLYVAPEAISRPSGGDAQSDLYSAGMVGLEALLGGGLMDAFPQLARSATPSRWLAWLRDTATDAVPVHHLRPEIPIEVSEFFGGLLSKDPQRRFQSADAALDALEAILPVVAALPAVPAPRQADAPPLRPTPFPSTMTPTPIPFSTPAPTLIGIPTPRGATLLTPATLRGATPAPTPVIPGTGIIVTGPDDFEERFELGERTLRIGRDSKNDIVLPDDTKSVSRMHAEIRREQGRYVLVDLDSQNGLWVGGKRKDSIQLGPGMSIKVGSYLLTTGGDLARAAAGSAPRPASPAPRPASSVAAGAAVKRDASKAFAQIAEIARPWLPPKTTNQWVIVGSLAAVLVAGVTWAAWPKGPSAAEIARQLKDDQDKKDSLERSRLAKEDEDRLSRERAAADARQNTLAAARSAMEGKQWQSAIDLVKPILDANPADEEALAIHKEATTGFEAEQRLQAAAKSAGGGKPKPKADEKPAMTPAEEKRQRLGVEYAAAERILDPAAALAAWQQLYNEDPAFQDVNERLTRAKRALAGALAAGAARSEQKGEVSDLLEARAAYQKALGYYPESPDIRDAQNRLNARMKKDGEAALDAATSRETTRSWAQAQVLYQKAMDLLLKEDPKWKDAKEGFDRVKGRI